MNATGSGRAAGTCGELVQGALPDGTLFQVTLPVDVWARVDVDLCDGSGAGIVGVPARLWKLRAAIDVALERHGTDQRHVGVRRRSHLPVGQGFGSSTADVVAGLRAVAAATGGRLSADELTGLAASVEPSDGVAYESVVAVSRDGGLVRHWAWAPRFVVVAVTSGREVDTVASDVGRYRRGAAAYADLLDQLDDAAQRRDATGFAAAGTASALLHAELVDVPVLTPLLGAARECRALGVVVAHTGACAAVLLPHDAERSVVRRAAGVVARWTRLCPTVLRSL